MAVYGEVWDVPEIMVSPVRVRVPPLKLSSHLQENVVVSYAARSHRAAEKNDVPGEQLGAVVGMPRFSKCRERGRLAKEP